MSPSLTDDNFKHKVCFDMFVPLIVYILESPAPFPKKARSMAGRPHTQTPLIKANGAIRPVLALSQHSLHHSGT